MTAGTEAHVLREVAHVGLSGVVLALEVSEVHQELRRRGFAGERGERVSFGSRHGRRGENQALRMILDLFDGVVMVRPQFFVSRRAKKVLAALCALTPGSVSVGCGAT